MTKQTAYNAPDFLDDIAKAQWNARIAQLAERNDIKPEDLTNLEIYCVNYSLFRQASEDITKNGFSFKNSQGSRSRNPALSAKSDAEKVMIKMSSLLGFDPVSRRRNPIETEETDVIDEILSL
ncbi:phage terminase small subunit P27 family [Caviibacterium pharyngocola]|uniref:Phage terminase small subunit P27 family n=1 Tax=Caviibacterium pharyngocola TaxID=28159 RepID=A0A2M8RSU6_9PAST|nr:phage terminase small subunit P27 family [Caviibacterium pharyngocola]PJG81964.1 phage terminase small subunit P27 family [Caviibacterium pharyngocola]